VGEQIVPQLLAQALAPDASAPSRKAIAFSPSGISELSYMSYTPQFRRVLDF
jgi:hypothetical protein